MNKVLASLLMIGVVAAMAGAGTFAAFTDLDTSVGNSITAGEIELAVNDNPALYDTVVEIGDIKPCWTFTVAKKVVLTNNPGFLYFNITDIVNSTGDTTYNGVSSEPEYEAEGMTYGAIGWTGSHTPVDDVSTQIDYDVGLYSDEQGNTAFGYTYSFSSLDAAVTAMNSYGNKMLPMTSTSPMAAGTEYWVIQTFTMHGTAGNEYQGDKCEFTENFLAQQTSTQPTP